MAFDPAVNWPVLYLHVTDIMATFKQRSLVHVVLYLVLYVYRIFCGSFPGLISFSQYTSQDTVAVIASTNDIFCVQ